MALANIACMSACILICSGARPPEAMLASMGGNTGCPPFSEGAHGNPRK